MACVYLVYWEAVRLKSQNFSVPFAALIVKNLSVISQWFIT